MNAVICHNGDKDKLFLTKVYLGSQEKITKDFLIQSMAFFKSRVQSRRELVQSWTDDVDFPHRLSRQRRGRRGAHAHPIESTNHEAYAILRQINNGTRKRNYLKR
jgi:hypothetical protein